MIKYLIIVIFLLGCSTNKNTLSNAEDIINKRRKESISNYEKSRKKAIKEHQKSMSKTARNSIKRNYKNQRKKYKKR